MKVVIKKARDSVTDAIEEMVFNGILHPGDRLVEAELVEKLGVSRTAIREALLLLEHRGLVKNQPYKGAVIAEYTEEDIRQMHEFRFCLESYAARQALKHLGPDDLLELETLVKKMNDAANREDTEEIYSADVTFHALILQKAGNKYIKATLDKVTVLTRRFSLMQKKLRHQLQDIPERHKPILDAFRRGNPEEVTNVLRKHILQQSLEGLLEWMHSHKNIS